MTLKVSLKSTQRTSPSTAPSKRKPRAVRVPTSSTPKPSKPDPIAAAGETLDELRDALKAGNPERIAAAARGVLVLLDNPQNAPALLAWLSWLNHCPGRDDPAVVAAATAGAAAALLWRA